jgi:hypothetical protein
MTDDCTTDKLIERTKALVSDGLGLSTEGVMKLVERLAYEKARADKAEVALRTQACWGLHLPGVLSE